MKKIFKNFLIFLKSIFKIKTTLEKPINDFDYFRDKKDNPLAGEWYEKTISSHENYSIRSPITGKIQRTYSSDLNYSMSLVNNLGLELIILIKKNGKLEVKNFKEKGLNVKKGEDIFYTCLKSSEEKLILSVIVPWQPKIIKKIERGVIEYRNPFLKLKVKNLYSY